MPLLYIHLFLIIIFQSSPCSTTSSFIIDLNGANWNFSSNNKTLNGKGTVPGDIFTDLYANDIIKNPLFGENHLELKWVSDNDWIYHRNFEVKSELLVKNAFLHIDELDTIATVFLNNQTILHSFNQFIDHNVNITGLLKSGTNTISVAFNSPTKYATILAKHFEKLNNHELPPVCPPSIYHGECHPNFIRKAQYSFSWDWGPSFPTVGITQNIAINFFDTHHFDDYTWTTELTKGFWYIHLELSSIHVDEIDIQYEVEIRDLIDPYLISYRLRNTKNRQRKTISTHKLEVSAENVEKWWPNGMGEQRMYVIRVKSGKREIEKLIAFKTVELVQSLINSKIPMLGRNFYFKVNNVPIFLKGSNWIPVSMFRNATFNTKRMEFLLDSAADVGMNVLRVWGGGFYESHEFYTYSAKKGILIWQDLMFACALYPTNKEFVKNVKSEVEHQIRRLKQYPSILVYAGNNENEAAIRGHWWKVSNYSENQQVRDYVKLYSQLARVVKHTDPSLPFVMSSPSNGIETESEGGVSKNPYDVRYGDIHFYNEFVNLWRDDSFLTPRCATEYGIQSFPLKQTMVKWINESDWEYTSQTLFHRQHHPGGIAFNLLMIFSHLPIPDQCSSKSFADLDKCEYLTSNKFMSRLAYFSQIHQMIALKTQTFHYRRFRNLTNLEGLGNTMCSMYWQLNDVWAAPTWSSIDFELSWKMAHYEMRRLFSSLSVYMYIDSADFNLEVVIVNDNSGEYSNNTLRIQQLSWKDGLDPVFSSDYHIDKIQATTAQEISLSLKLPKYSELSEYLYVADVFNGKNELLTRDVLLPDFLFEINFKDFGTAKIEYATRSKPGVYDLLISTDKISPFTWVQCLKEFNGWFSDNGFHMIERTKSIQLILKEDIILSAEDFEVCNLANCYS